MSSSEAPYFCKIILEDTIRLNKLRFPRKFVRKHGSELSSPVQLTVPDGVTFPVEVVKSDDGEIWLENGWHQFSEHYCLKNGYFLVFEYEGNCSFQVLLFDMSEADIDYPYISDSDDGGDEECQQPNKEEVEKEKEKEEEEEEAAAAEDNTSSEVEEEEEEEEAKDLPELRTGKKHRPRKKRRKTTSDKSRDLGNGRKCPEQAVILGFERMTAEEKAETLRIANSFNSKNPFFLSVIQPLNASRKYMSIPSNFAKKFLTKTPGDKAILCLPDGKSWFVKYFSRVYHKNHPNAQFSTGWKKFALDNRLVVGDICVFELLERAEITLKVVIHRVADVANCDTSEAPELPKQCSYSSSQASEASASRLASNIPLFKMYIRPSSLDCHGRVSVPFDFIEKHLNLHTENLILRVADTMWSVKLKVYKHRCQGHLTAGWKTFARETSLKVGDVCVFELITSSNDAMLDVFIYRRYG